MSLTEPRSTQRRAPPGATSSNNRTPEAPRLRRGVARWSPTIRTSSAEYRSAGISAKRQDTTHQPTLRRDVPAVMTENGCLPSRVIVRARDSVVPHQLPPDIRWFAGRTAELAVASAEDSYGGDLRHGRYRQDRAAVHWCPSRASRPAGHTSSRWTAADCSSTAPATAGEAPADSTTPARSQARHAARRCRLFVRARRGDSQA